MFFQVKKVQDLGNGCQGKTNRETITSINLLGIFSLSFWEDHFILNFLRNKTAYPLLSISIY